MNEHDETVTLSLFAFGIIITLIVAYTILKSKELNRIYAEKCYEQTQYLGCYGFDALSSMGNPKHRK